MVVLVVAALCRQHVLRLLKNTFTQLELTNSSRIAIELDGGHLCVGRLHSLLDQCVSILTASWFAGIGAGSIRPWDRSALNVDLDSFRLANDLERGFTL